MQKMSVPHCLDMPVAAPWPRQGASGFDRDMQFVELLNGYRHSGGLARAMDMNAALRQRGGADIATVAQWMQQREVLHFEWQAQTWLPLFQFGRQDLRPHGAVGRSILALAAALNPWQVAQWFILPNSELAQRCPADAWAADPAAVWRAACADRHGVDA